MPKIKHTNIYVQINKGNIFISIFKGNWLPLETRGCLEEDKGKG